MTRPEIPALEAPLTFEAPPPAAPGIPNPMPAGIPWNQPITPTLTEPADQTPIPKTVANES